MKDYFAGLFTIGFGFCIIGILRREYFMGLIILGILSLIGLIIEYIIYKKNQNANCEGGDE